MGEAGKVIAGGWKNPSMRSGGRRALTSSRAAVIPIRVPDTHKPVVPARIVGGRVSAAGGAFEFAVCAECEAWDGSVWFAGTEVTAANRKCYCAGTPLAFGRVSGAVLLSSLLGVTAFAARTLAAGGVLTAGDAARRGPVGLRAVKGIGATTARAVWVAVEALSGPTDGPEDNVTPIGTSAKDAAANLAAS